MGERSDPKPARAALIARGLGKTWDLGTPRATPALVGVDFEVAPGEFVVVLGPSGCGKSTLLHLIAGLERATAGELWAFGQRIDAPSPERALIFQEPTLFPWLTVRQNVAFGLRLRGTDRLEAQARAQQVLSQVGLRDVADRQPRALSGGMRQRVAVARALALQPKLLLMDEPFAALDVQTRARMQAFLLDAWRASAASVLFVTHHIEEALALADRILVLTARPGRIKQTTAVDLPRPRDPLDHRCLELRRALTEALAIEVEEAFAEQERHMTTGPAAAPARWFLRGRPPDPVHQAVEADVLGTQTKGALGTTPASGRVGQAPPRVVVSATTARGCAEAPSRASASRR